MRDDITAQRLEKATRFAEKVRPIWKSGKVTQTDSVYSQELGHFVNTGHEARIAVGESGGSFYARLEERNGRNEWSEPKATRGAAIQEGKSRLNGWLEENGVSPSRHEGPSHEPQSVSGHEEWRKIREQAVNEAVTNGKVIEHRLSRKERAEILKPDMPQSAEEEQRMIRALYEESTDRKRGVRR